MTAHTIGITGLINIYGSCNKTSGSKVNRDQLGRPLDDQGRNTTTLGGDPATPDAGNYAPKSSKDTSGRIDPEMGSEVTDPVLNFRPNQQPAGRTEPKMGRDPNSPATLQDLRDFSASQANAAADAAASEGPGFLGSNWGKIATGTGLAGEYAREKINDRESAKARGEPVPPFWSTTTFDPRVDLNKQSAPNTQQQTKESLQNKLFKEFKTFVEKR